MRAHMAVPAMIAPPLASGSPTFASTGHGNTIPTTPTSARNRCGMPADKATYSTSKQVKCLPSTSQMASLVH